MDAAEPLAANNRATKIVLLSCNLSPVSVHRGAVLGNSPGVRGFLAPFQSVFQKSRNLRFAHASAEADAYNLLTHVGASFSWRGREAAFASFETASHLLIWSQGYAK